MMKRNLSDMDSDCDDVFASGDNKECPSQGEDGHYMINRKRRRGVIEKRRRDRINNCLSELRRLVPAAFEKQGSAKLEKAEILQMTVEHLKLLHAKGVDPFSLEPHKLFMDYHSIGFRECASEVARYLVAIEGLDLQDPLRLRLMSHLQCYSAQRDLVIKSATVHSPWNTSSSSLATLPPTPQYLSQPVAPPVVPNSSSINLEATPIAPYSPSELRVPHQSLSADNISSSCLLPPHLEHQVPRALSNSVTSISSSTMQPSINSSSSPTNSSHFQMATTQYPTTQVLSTNGYGWSSGSPQPSSSTKPYRPWGAELAY